MLVFSHIFPLLWKFTFHIFGDLYGLMLHMKYVKNPYLWNVYVFPHVSLTMRIYFSYVFGIVWVSVSLEICKKSIPLECLCFPKIFPYYGNSLFPCFGNCIDYCLETLALGMFFFPILFHTIGNHFPHFWGQYY